MALQTNMTGLTQGRKAAKPRKAQSSTSKLATASVPEWDENSPSYLDGILETLATLTEEEKDDVHRSLQG